MPPSQTKNTMAAGWDCQSSLYDTFELKSFNTQLASAINAASGRSFSMPHTSKSGPNHKKTNTPKSRISKSIHRLIGTVFGVTPTVEDRSIDRDEMDEYLCEGCLLDIIAEKEEEEDDTVVVVKKRADVKVKLDWKVKATALERWFAGRRVGMCR